MLPRSIILAAIAVAALLLVGIAGAFALDASRADVIAKGVSIGPVEVGGMSREEARTHVRQRLVEPLNEPLEVRALDEKVALSAREAHIRIDVDAMLDEAIERGRSGGVLARTWRALSGQEVDASVPPDVQYSRRAVQRIVDRLRVAVSRRAVDAKVDFKPQDIAIRPSRDGRTIDALKLRGEVEKALISPTSERTLTAEVRTVQPKVTIDKLAGRYPVALAVDRGGFRITLFKKLEKVKSYPIAVGEVGRETPPGLYTIQNKAVNPAWTVPNSDWAGSLAGQVIPGGTPQNPLKSRWLGVYDGVGVHGTDARGSIGTNASKGCIRMLVEDVEELYDQVPVGTPIYIG